MENPDSKPANQVDVKAIDCPVTKVTVYKDRAEVCRQVEATVKAGVNEIHVKDFVRIDEESIRVEGKGEATIAEVSFQSKVVSEDEVSMPERQKKLTEELKTLEEELKQLNTDSHLQAIDKQWKILDQFSVTAAKNGQGDGSKEKNENFQLDSAYFKGMREFIDQYKDIGRQLEAERLDLSTKRDEVKLKIDTVKKKMRELGDNSNVQENRECVIVLEAEKETKVLLVVSYVVLGAYWTPTYDLRMFTDQGVLKIFYYGLICQNSGEDWNNVKLFLSTAEPSVGGTIPELPQTQLSIRKYRPVLKKKGMSLFGGGGARGPPAPPPPPQAQAMYMAASETFMSDMVAVDLQVSESTTSTTYEIARQSTIPSDNIEHKVSVAIIDLKPTLTYLTVPKVVPHAFLQAKVVNTSQYMMLAGRTNIFLDNSFVAKAEIKSVAPKEEFECSLGVDPGVRVDYKPVIKVNSTSGLISKTDCTMYEQNIELKNMHDYPVTVLVRDNLPRSLDEKIKVNLVTPHVDMKHPDKSTGVRITKNNHVEWDLNMTNLATQEVTLKYSVEHPASEDIETTTTIGN